MGNYSVQLMVVKLGELTAVLMAVPKAVTLAWSMVNLMVDR